MVEFLVNNYQFASFHFLLLTCTRPCSSDMHQATCLADVLTWFYLRFASNLYESDLTYRLEATLKKQKINTFLLDSLSVHK